MLRPETRGSAALLTMWVVDLIPRNGSAVVAGGAARAPRLEG
jgi:hypothetical protein